MRYSTTTRLPRALSTGASVTDWHSQGPRLLLMLYHYPSTPGTVQPFVQRILDPNSVLWMIPSHRIDQYPVPGPVALPPASPPAAADITAPCLIVTSLYQPIRLWGIDKAPTFSKHPVLLRVVRNRRCSGLGG
jgi:hypothetical protein